MIKRYFDSLCNKENRNDFKSYLKSIDFKATYNKNYINWRKFYLKKISFNALKLYIYFEMNINVFEYCYFSFTGNKLIKEEISLSDEEIIVALKELFSMNLISVYECGGQNIYFLKEYIKNEQFDLYIKYFKYIFEINLCQHPNFKEII